MLVTELIKKLEKEYPDTLQGVMNTEDLIARKAEQDLINYIKLMMKEK